MEVDFNNEQADLDLSSMAKALGHPARVKIIRTLMRKKNCICGALVEDLGMPQSTVSQHLKVLKESGLVQGEIEGPKTCYCVDEKKLKYLQTLIVYL